MLIKICHKLRRTCAISHHLLKGRSDKLQPLFYCFPKKPAKLFFVQITVLKEEWHIAWFAGASVNIFVFKACCSHWCCLRHLVTCVVVPAHQMAVVTNPPPPHMHSLPHVMWHNDRLGGGPHVCKCLCPRWMFNLVITKDILLPCAIVWTKEDCGDVSLPLDSLRHPLLK